MLFEEESDNSSGRVGDLIQELKEEEGSRCSTFMLPPKQDRSMDVTS